jgi:MFS family permease
MFKSIKNVKSTNIFSNAGFNTLLLIIFADSVGNGMSKIILPALLNDLGGASAWLGTIIGIQSLLGIIIFLPQATLIKKIGEKLSVRISIFINVLVYILYLFGQPIFISIGKFIEGVADRLLNSSASKVIYDQTDGSNNRGRMRAYMDTVRGIAVVASPAVAAMLMKISINVPIIIASLIMFISFMYSRKLSESKQEETVSPEDNKNETILQKYYLNHFKLYLKNKFIVAITIPSICFSCLDIFYSIILNLYLLKYKGFSYSQIALIWSVISIISIVLQIPSGILADKRKNYSFLICLVLNCIGFSIMLSTASSVVLLMISVVLINTGCIFFTSSMSALFGDLTTKENRLSESESYRMVRAIGEGLFTIILSFIFDKNPIFALTIVFTFIVLGTIITLVINSLYQKKLKTSIQNSNLNA